MPKFSIQRIKRNRLTYRFEDNEISTSRNDEGNHQTRNHDKLFRIEKQINRARKEFSRVNQNFPKKVFAIQRDRSSIVVQKLKRDEKQTVSIHYQSYFNNAYHNIALSY